MPEAGTKRQEIVTFVGDVQAKVGFRFVASQPPEVCKGCKLFLACMSKLKPGKVYEVVEVKDKEHYCPLYEGSVKVVKVAEAPVEALVKSNLAVEGATVEPLIEDCGKKCPLKVYCTPEWAEPGKKVKLRICQVIEDVSDKAACGKKLKKVAGMATDGA
ncbi:MAG: UPF0179 family protein [Candidatus Methanosuratincola sp.]|jgi:uncharacterized protein (UPF0179 family)|uniref:UPF0179 protein ENL91_05235 n=2 Tax=Candidatus Methanosuratincola (ex Vanwonterghem et al. 2016) TaxID=1915412 RepID=A0A7J3V0G0_9CREN|nr:UPF0179 family protein [Candidatus Methanosuratincola sp.]RWX73128.1 MAG: hypothetical protein Metus_1102 [Candidatus Methanosuratincola subterraneus]